MILPVYNVSKYISKCLDSIINQTYKELEIICVDDCSTDNSPEIIQQYANKDSRIKILKNSKNLGVGLTRNAGLKAASGDFVHFVDPDDWLELNTYEALSHYLSPDVDAVRFTFFEHDEKSGEKTYIGYSNLDYLYKKINIYNTPQSFRIWSPSTWVKIYRREFLLDNAIYYNDYTCLEDIEYALHTALKAKNIIFIETPLLHYRANRKNSLMTLRTANAINIINGVNYADNIATTLPVKTKTAVLNYIYEMLVMNMIDAFYENKISFHKMKEVFTNNINKEIFRENDIFNAKEAVKIYNLVLKNNALSFFLKYNLKRFLKEHLRLKKRIVKLIKRIFKC